MTEDRQPDSNDLPEDPSQPDEKSSSGGSKPSGSGSEGWVLGGGLGSGGSGSASGMSSSGGSGAGSENPFESFFSSLSGGDMNAFMQQIGRAHV